MSFSMRVVLPEFLYPVIPMMGISFMVFMRCLFFFYCPGFIFHWLFFVLFLFPVGYLH